MDADIDAVTTSLDLDKIKAQDYRNELRSLASYRTEQLAAVQKQVQDQGVLGASLTSGQEFRQNIAIAIAANYCKPTTTSTSQALIDADSANDAQRLKSAVDAVAAAFGIS
jgi:maleate cis-trans isomerase